MKAIKLKACINMANDWMYLVYWNRSQESITLGVMSLGSFQKLNCILLNNFYVCGPTYHTEVLKKWYIHGQWVDVSCIQESGPWAHNS